MRTVERYGNEDRVLLGLGSRFGEREVTIASGKFVLCFEIWGLRFLLKPSNLDP